MTIEVTETLFKNAIARLKADPCTQWVPPFKTTKEEPDDNSLTAPIHDVVDLRKDVSKLLKNLGANVVISDCNPLYKPADHQIMIPHPSMYDSMDTFYHSLFHELGHWTWRPMKRLTIVAGMYNDMAVRVEELTAELTALFLCEAFGVKGYGHVKYIDSFGNGLPKDALSYAVNQAKSATQYLLKHQ